MAKPDIICKEFWNNERCADLFNTVLFKGEQLIKPDDLMDMDTDVSSSLEFPKSIEALKKTRDIFKKSKQGVDFLIVGIENQDEINYSMPMRTMIYDGLCYYNQVRDIGINNKKNDIKSGNKAEFLSGMKKTDKINPVITLVIYYGEKPWDGETSLKGMMNSLHPTIMGLVSDYKMNLLEIRNAKEYKFSNPNLELIFDISNELLNGNLEKIKKEYQADILSSEELRFIGYITKSKKFMNSRKEKITMCEALQKWEDKTFKQGRAEGVAEGKAEGIAEGKAEGIAEGKAEGIAEEKRNIAIAFLDIADDETIATKTGLPIEEVEQLRKDNQ
ncbi:MAG: hypothetical protein ATN35_09225 [Epulopiscium sp. Nele67-Bin004]|nr:MAG: hypothetical protein ATN35_09225 [Epulopiscium sp. Nele67-Bin004]